METTISIEPPVVEFEDHYFGIEWLSTEDMIIDPNYQRPKRLALIKTIAEEWDWRAVRTLAVSMRKDGTYAIIDGQQRFTAARERNITKLPCQVYLDLSPQQEAELFLKLNNSSKPNTNDMFRAKLAEGDPEAKLIMMAINNTNWTIDLDKNTAGKKGGDWCSTELASAASIVEIYRSGGVLHLQSVLNILHGWFGQSQAGSADMMKGMSIFLLKYKGKIDMVRLTERLAKETPSGILGNAIQYLAAQRAMQVSGQFTRKTAIAAAIVGIYNKGLKPNARLEA